jgi:hypothetical protein
VMKEEIGEAKVRREVWSLRVASIGWNNRDKGSIYLPEGASYCFTLIDHAVNPIMRIGTSFCVINAFNLNALATVDRAFIQIVWFNFGSHGSSHVLVLILKSMVATNNATTLFPVMEAKDPSRMHTGIQGHYIFHRRGEGNYYEYQLYQYRCEILWLIGVEAGLV